MDETVVSVEDADVEAATIVDLDASGVVQSCWLGSRQMRWRQQFPVVSNTVEASFFCEQTEREKDGGRGAEIVPQGLSRPVPPLTIW